MASWDEAIYASVAKEVVQSGDWLRLTLSGTLWFDKPPLAIWVTALFYKLLGVNEFSARLFSALCGVGCVITTYYLGRELMNRWVGFIGALILLSTSHFLRFSRFGMMDAPLTFFMTLALSFFWLGHFKNRYLIFSGIAIGLGVMTKGFAALLVFPVIGVYCWASGRLALLARPSYWTGVLIAVLIVFPWHAYQFWMYHDVFLKDVVLKHLVTRTTTALDGHFGSWYFYLRVLVNKFHPWILIAIFSAPFFLFKAVKDREDSDIFLSSWIFFIFTTITLVKTKLSWYVIPIYPPLSLTAAVFLSKLFKESYSLYVKAIFLVVLALHVPYSRVFDHDYSRDIKGIAAATLEAVPKTQQLYLYQYHESPAVSFYLGRSAAYLDTREDFLKRSSEPRFYCLIHANRLDSMGLLSSDLSRLGLKVQASFEGLRLLAKI